MATAAIVNGLWDLWARLEGKPVWKLLVDMTPEEIISLVDFSWITDELTQDEALQILKNQYETRGEREKELSEKGFPGMAFVHVIYVNQNFSVPDGRLVELRRGIPTHAAAKGQGRGMDAGQGKSGQSTTRGRREATSSGPRRTRQAENDETSLTLTTVSQKMIGSLSQ